MNKIIEEKLLIGIGAIIGITIVDMVKEGKFDLSKFLIRVVVIAILFAILSFIELRYSKK